MALQAEDVRRVARRARLDLTPDEVRRLARELNQILDHVQCLEDFDAGPEALSSAAEEAEGRETQPPSWPPGDDSFRQNAPRLRDGFLVVPVIKSKDGNPSAGSPE